MDGTTTMYEAFTYQVKGGKINSISPGVFFYYVTLKGSDLPITVEETNTLGWLPMLRQQSTLYDANCNKLASTWSTGANPYSVTLDYAGADPDATYYIGIMYSHANLKGQPVTAPYPTSTYSWQADNGDGGDSIDVKPK